MKKQTEKNLLLGLGALAVLFLVKNKNQTGGKVGRALITESGTTNCDWIYDCVYRGIVPDCRYVWACQKNK